MMPDMFPTILEWLGLNASTHVRAGIGVSLLGDTQTLMLTQEYGADLIDRRLRADIPLAQRIWQEVR
jgi:hypothetical protein